MRELLRASLPLHGANVLNFVTHRVDVFFVQAQHGAREVGVYALAVSLAQFLLLASGAFAQPLLPNLAAQTDPTEAGRIAARITRLYLVIALLGAVAVAAVMTWALPLIFGRAFEASVVPLLVLLPGVIAFGATNILISYFFGQGHTGFNLVLALAGLAVTLAGNLTLTPRYGALGAAVTSTLAYAAAGILAVMGLARFSRVSALGALCPRSADFRELAGLLWRFRI
jgi:O-antigen/teichoic acid export membrane protein